MDMVKWDKGKQMADQSDKGIFFYHNWEKYIRNMLYCYRNVNGLAELRDSDTMHVSCDWDAQMKDTVKWLKVWKGN